MQLSHSYKLAVWDARQLCFRDGKRAHATAKAARAAAREPGRYRISEISREGRVDGKPFTIAGTPPVPPRVVPFKNCTPTAASLVHGVKYAVKQRRAV